VVCFRENKHRPAVQIGHLFGVVCPLVSGV
jgi:hypothetical protein